MEEQLRKKERAVLAGLSAASMDEHERSTEISMEELAALVETAGGEPVAMLIQNRPSPEPRSFIGDGKVQEICALKIITFIPRSATAPTRPSRWSSPP